MHGSGGTFRVRGFPRPDSRDDLQVHTPLNPTQGDTPMKSSAKDQLTGKLHEIKGAVKEIAGKATDNPQLESEGTAEKITGTVQRTIGEVKKVFGK